VIKQCYFDGLTVDEVAESLRVSQARVSQLRMRAFKVLRDVLSDGEPLPPRHRRHRKAPAGQHHAVVKEFAAAG
jgi:DNA-directed RNA polymerase specialized sigma24 family protein